MTSVFNETYEIKSVIGKGGMSTVYLAEHKRLHTCWAVKEVIKQPSSPVDFLAEAKILKRLRHPALPQIIDIFEDDESVIIVEDFVEGVSLKEFIGQHGRIDEKTGLDWFGQLSEVLMYLHSQIPPIIYRDMKPANVMLQPDGKLKLIDFGIAREYKQDSSADTTYIGTKGYAAPEQFGKAQTDARTDIYSLGVTMYHLLTGKSPYDPPYQFVRARQLVPELSFGMEHILAKCVKAEPEERYQSVGDLLYDLGHIYLYDKGYKKSRAVRGVKIAGLTLMFAASIGLCAGGFVKLGFEKQDRFDALLSEASEYCLSDPEKAFSLIDEAEGMFPERVEPRRQRVYTLLKNGRWQECVDEGESFEKRFGKDTSISPMTAAARFELGDYEGAAAGFAESGELSDEYKVDYAVCLGRIGKVDEGEGILSELMSSGMDSETLDYIHGELLAARGEYSDAEDAFMNVLSSADDAALTRRCYYSLGYIYRKCAALDRTGESPIKDPATKSVKILSKAVSEDAMRYDSALWESLAMAYFESYHTDPSVPAEYLTRAAECFERVIELGVTKDYLFTDIYTIYYEQKDYEKAEDALTRFESVYPKSYTPHALRAMLLITIENEKPQNERDYTAAAEEYKTAGELLTSSDSRTYYDQLGTLIQNLKNNGWID